MKYDAQPLGWVVAEDVFNAGHIAKCESIFAQGNGYMNLRNALEENYVGQRRGAFIAGTFNKALPDEVTELPNLPDVDLGVFPLHEVYEFYGIHLLRGEQNLGITRLDSPDARLLDVDPRRGVLTLQCVRYGSPGRADGAPAGPEDEQPVEFTRTHIRADKCDLSVHFRR